MTNMVTDTRKYTHSFFFFFGKRYATSKCKCTLVLKYEKNIRCHLKKKTTYVLYYIHVYTRHKKDLSPFF